ncbi:MAG: hypothetical protein QXG98_05240 [Candidatus Micrarchaeia archaeon]
MRGKALILSVVFILLFVLAWRLYFHPGAYTPPSGVAFNLSVPGYVGGTALPPERGNAHGVLLIDTFHAAKPIDTGELTARVSALGYAVEYVLGERELERKLADADALLLVLPSGLSESERNEIERFTRSGGRVLLLADPDIDSEAGALAAGLGIAFGNGYAYNLQDNAGNYRYVLATFAEGSELGRGVRAAAFYTACPVEGNVVGLARAGTQVFPYPAVGEVGLVAEGNNTVAICDVHFLQPPYAFAYDNQALIQNLARFLTGGRRMLGLADFPAVMGESVTILYANESLFEAALTLKKAIEGSEVRKMEAGAEVTGNAIALAFFEEGMAIGSASISKRTISLPGIGELARERWAVVVLEPRGETNRLLVAGENEAAVGAAVAKLIEGGVAQFEVRPGLALVPVKSS